MTREKPMRIVFPARRIDVVSKSLWRGFVG
jgi:hypothetical protein